MTGSSSQMVDEKLVGSKLPGVVMLLAGVGELFVVIEGAMGI